MDRYANPQDDNASARSVDTFSKLLGSGFGLVSDISVRSMIGIFAGFPMFSLPVDSTGNIGLTLCIASCTIFMCLFVPVDLHFCAAPDFPLTNIDKTTLYLLLSSFTFKFCT